MTLDVSPPGVRFSLRQAFAVVNVAAFLFAMIAWRPVDGIDDYLLGCLARAAGDDDTTWTDDYSETGFKHVVVGMTRKQVYALLGKPWGSLRWNGLVLENWTRSPSDSSYWERTITFEDIAAEEKAKVVERISGFYVD